MSSHFHQKILILDFGSQYTQLIARRVRELNVYCDIQPYRYRIPHEDPSIMGIILSGSPFSVLDPGAPAFALMDEWLGRVPVLAICYGAQLGAYYHGGKVEASSTREYGRARLVEIAPHPLLDQVREDSTVWMSHGDSILALPEGAKVIASTPDVRVAAYAWPGRHFYGLQFHPEVYHTEDGPAILRNFLVDLCGCRQDWTPAQFVEETVTRLQKQIPEEDHVVMALSGGVDSTVAAALLQRAVGDRLHAIFVNNGLLRKNEYTQVLASYESMGLNVKGIDASAAFMRALEGVEDPEQKRKQIGRMFIDTFDQAAEELPGVRWLGQGTIYPDVIESVSVNGPSVTIKSHHNVGGLPEQMNLQVVEPLRALFKDEVRRAGRELALPDTILGRHPFPGPGLAIRILGAVSPGRIALLQEADALFIQGLRDHGLYHQIWQAGAVLLPVQAVGVMGDERTYENVVALRAVTSVDGMTADWAHLPYTFMAEISNRIINQVKGINRVVYDISSKPPATIEWE